MPSNVAAAPKSERDPCNVPAPGGEAARGRQLTDGCAVVLSGAARSDKGQTPRPPRTIGRRRDEKIVRFGCKFPGGKRARHLAPARRVEALNRAGGVFLKPR